MAGVREGELVKSGSGRGESEKLSERSQLEWPVRQ